MMGSGFFCFPLSDSHELIQGSHCVQDCKKEEVGTKGKQVYLYGIEDWEDFDPFCSDFGYVHQEAKKGAYQLEDDQPQQQQPEETKSNYVTPEEFPFDSDYPTRVSIDETPKQKNIEIRSGLAEFIGPDNEKSYLGLSAMELLCNSGSGFRKSKPDLCSTSVSEETSNMGGVHKLSMEGIMQVAAARYLQFSEMRYDDLSMVMHPFGYALSGLSEEEMRDVELVHLLLAAAEKLAYQQLEPASRLLSHCEWIASKKGNPVQRIVLYFAEALRERIDKEKGTISSKELDQAKGDFEATHGLGTNIVFVEMHMRLPFLQVMQFTGIQAILENLGSASKVHLIDLEIRSGVQWAVLIQALAERDEQNIELLKITAVGLTGKEKIKETGNRLKTLADSMNLPLLFNTVYVSDMAEIKEELFEIKDGEYVAVYSPLILRTMISRPSCLEKLMTVIKNLNPSIMVVIEVEANHNSPSFVNRFVEALFFYSTYFDCLETFMNDNVELRVATEQILSKGIREIVAMDGSDRVARSVKMEVWKAFFARYKMVEIGFSDCSLYQAGLVIKQFPRSTRHCTLAKNGKSVIVGWKGTPLNSVSAWKFSVKRYRRPFLNHRFSNA